MVYASGSKSHMGLYLSTRLTQANAHVGVWQTNGPDTDGSSIHIRRDGPLLPAPSHRETRLSRNEGDESHNFRTLHFTAGRNVRKRRGG